MLEVTPVKFWRDFNFLKVAALGATKHHEYDDAYLLLKTAAKLAYNLQFTYFDDDMERIIEQIAGTTLEAGKFVPIKHRFVFYDCFGMDNRGLTQQYVRALITWDVEFLYIFDSSEGQQIGPDILKELERCQKAEIYVASSKHGSLISKSQEIINRIESFRPEMAFIHIAPWSVMAVGIWNRLPCVKRYLIDLTDHAFWLGKCCADYFIGFREYGKAIAFNFRNIEETRLLQQKFYPIESESVFQGFPRLAEEKIKIFCGANYYKVYGKNGMFLDILKRIVTDNPSSVILFAGVGNVGPLLSFINKHNLKERILLLGNRNDIGEVVKQSDIFLSTYPLGGGLMVQYALKYAKPVIAYSTPDLSLTSIVDLCKSTELPQLVFYDLEQFHKRINTLVNNQDARHELSTQLTDSIITPREFSVGLRELISTNHSSPFGEVSIDRKAIEDLYLEMENHWIKQYEYIKLHTLGARYFRYNFSDAVLSLIKIVILRYQKIPARLVWILNYVLRTRR